MDFARFNRPNSKAFDNGIWNSRNHLVVIKFPNTRILRVIFYSLFFALVILTFPCITSILRQENGSEFFVDMVDSEQLDLFFRDLGHEALTIKGHKALILSSSAETNGLIQIRVLDGDEHKLNIVVDSDFDRSGLFSDDSFDFVLSWGFVASDFVDRILKTGGIVAFPLNNNDPSNRFQNKPNYRPVFLNRYSSIIVAMEKTAMADQQVYVSASRRRLFQFSFPTTNAALRDIEDVQLEPSSIKDVAKPNKLGRKIKYLPNLVDGFLEASRQGMESLRFPKIDLQPEESTSNNVAARNAVSES